MKAGNKTYITSADLPETLALFPLSGALLLPKGQLSLNVFEPRYLTMVEDAMNGNRLIGMIQPQHDELPSSNAQLYPIGTIGRIVSYNETGDGRILIHLQGICRFNLDKESMSEKPYRIAKIIPWLDDLTTIDKSEAIDREELLSSFKEFLEANNMEADWEGITQASTASLVNALSSIAPLTAAEKQALLEAKDTTIRAQTLIALTERTLMTKTGHESSLN